MKTATMAVKKVVKPRKVVQLHTELIKNITDREQKVQGISHYMAKINAKEFLDSGLRTSRNLRDALCTNGGRLTEVHRALNSTLADSPEEFSTLNSGILVSAVRSEMANKDLILYNPSIINGAQTQQALIRAKERIEEYVKDTGGGKGALEMALQKIHIKMEIIITADKDYETEITIARNTQHKVKTYSILNCRGTFDRLLKILKANGIADEFAFTESDEQKVDNRTQISQLVRLLIMFIDDDTLAAANLGVKSKYGLGTRMAPALAAWTKLQETEDISPDVLAARKKALKMCEDIAIDVWRIHKEWREDMLLSKGLHGLDRRRKDFRNPEGLFYASYAFISQFIENNNGKWVISKEWESYHPVLIKTLRASYKANGNNASAMMRDTSCYTTLQTSGETALFALGRI